MQPLKKVQSLLICHMSRLGGARRNRHDGSCSMSEKKGSRRKKDREKTLGKHNGSHCSTQSGQSFQNRRNQCQSPDNVAAQYAAQPLLEDSHSNEQTNEERTGQGSLLLVGIYVSRAPWDEIDIDRITSMPMKRWVHQLQCQSIVSLYLLATGMCKLRSRQFDETAV